MHAYESTQICMYVYARKQIIYYIKESSYTWMYVHMYVQNACMYVCAHIYTYNIQTYRIAKIITNL